jgi:ribosome maturation factor RimP
VDIEHRREGRGTVLRLLVDRAGGPGGAPAGGVSIDELTALSRRVSDVLDVHEDAVAGAYSLEVSSPGIHRPLARPAHFPPYVGKHVHVRTRRPVGERHTFRGVLQEVGEHGIVVATDDGQSHAISFDEISRANYQHQFSPPGGGARRAGGQRPGHRRAAR